MPRPHPGIDPGVGRLDPLSGVGAERTRLNLASMNQLTSHQDDRPGQKLVLLTLIGSLVMVGTMASLHVLEPALNPITEVMSYYRPGRYRVVFAISLTAFGIGPLRARYADRRAHDCNTVRRSEFRRISQEERG